MSHNNNIESNNIINTDAYIEMDTINCFICLDNEYITYITLTCCGKKIHKTCLLKWIIDDNNKELSCPMCRSKMLYLNTIISSSEMICFFEDNENDISIVKCKMIIKELYEKSLIHKLITFNNIHFDTEIARYNFYNMLCFTISCWGIGGLIVFALVLMIKN